MGVVCETICRCSEVCYNYISGTVNHQPTGIQTQTYIGQTMNFKHSHNPKAWAGRGQSVASFTIYKRKKSNIL